MAFNTKNNSIFNQICAPGVSIFKLCGPPTCLKSALGRPRSRQIRDPSADWNIDGFICYSKKHCV